PRRAHVAGAAARPGQRVGPRPRGAAGGRHLARAQGRQPRHGQRKCRRHGALAVGALRPGGLRLRHAQRPVAAPHLRGPRAARAHRLAPAGALFPGPYGEHALSRGLLDYRPIFLRSHSMPFAGPLAVLAALAALAAPPRDSVPQMRVRVDSSRHEVVVLAGPFRVPPSPPDMDHMMMMDGSDHDMDMNMPLTPVQTFDWPVTGWMHGFKVELVDDEGRVLPQRLMHHLIAVNFSRRQ